MRTHALLAALLLILAASTAQAILLRTFGDQLAVPRGLVMLALLPLLFYLVFISPGRRYRAWGYNMADSELQLRRGVWTQVHTTVPLDRVQHIDISQGPLERMFEVCRLVLHTAGTMHSLVVLPGLDRNTAERMRDEIRARIGREPE
jgi:membrane protein YdbS with pleckstrin-like domain